MPPLAGPLANAAGYAEMVLHPSICRPARYLPSVTLAAMPMLVPSPKKAGFPIPPQSLAISAQIPNIRPSPRTGRASPCMHLILNADPMDLIRRFLLSYNTVRFLASVILPRHEVQRTIYLAASPR